MSIGKVEAFVLRHRLRERRGPSILDYDWRESVLVKISDTDGFAGWGETYLLSGLEAALDELGALLIGLDPLNARLAWQTLRRAGASAYALSGLSLALDDLRARKLGLPVSDLYGGRMRDRVEAYASSGGYYAGRRPAETWPREVEELADRGFRGIKLRIGRYPVGEELPILERIRAQLPPAVKLMADGNAAYTYGQALQMGEGLGRIGFTWFEEPLPQHDGYVGYERLNAALDIALAGGEITETRGQALDLVDRAAVDIIQPDVSICGGVGELLFIAELAQLEAIRCIPHVWLGAVSTAATLQLLAVLPDPTRSPATEPPLLEYDVGENPFRAELVTQPLAMQDGMIAIPSTPGIGVEVNEAYVRRTASASAEVAS